MEKLSLLLKDQTKQHHDRTEEVLRAGNILSGAITLMEYKRLIHVLYTFHRQYEAPVFEQVEKIFPENFDLKRRIKLTRLEKDMTALNSVAEPGDSAEILNAAIALGFLYVMEGSTLGGQVIVKSLMKQSFIVDTHALHYYTGYGEKTGLMWKEFKDTLDSFPEDPKFYQQVVDGASTAFQRMIDIAISNNSLR